MSREQLAFADRYLINMLKDYASDAFKKTCKNSLARMFSVKSALVKKTLLKWFNAKFKRKFTIINPIEKIKYERENKVDWQKSECTICKFPIKLNITNFNNPKMTYGDYIVRFEYKFLRDIFSNEQLLSAYQIMSLENYYEFFEEFIDICIGLLAALNGNQSDFINEATENFAQGEFPDETIPEIKNIIQKNGIKNALGGQIYKFNLKVYAFVYDKLLYLPKSDIEYDAFTSNKFFLYVHRLTKGKVHLHHSHVTGEILGYDHDFCNTILVERINGEIPLVAHNFFGFDIFYFLKTCVAIAWCSKKLSIGGSNLTQVNYGIIDNELKLIDSLKYYQKILHFRPLSLQWKKKK